MSFGLFVSLGGIDIKIVGPFETKELAERWAADEISQWSAAGQFTGIAPKPPNQSPADYLEQVGEMCGPSEYFHVYPIVDPDNYSPTTSEPPLQAA